jgi:hypothetical protein
MKMKKWYSFYLPISIKENFGEKIPFQTVSGFFSLGFGWVFNKKR